jgi:hypothetical protein
LESRSGVKVRALVQRGPVRRRGNLGYDTFWEPTVFPGQPTPPPRAQDYAKAKQLLAPLGTPYAHRAGELAKMLGVASGGCPTPR